MNKHFYHNRVVDIWNSLPFNVVSSQSICAFKGRLRPVNFDQFLIIVRIFYISFFYSRICYGPYCCRLYVS